MEKNIRQRLVLLLIIPFLVSYIINLLITIGFKTGLDILMSIANISLYLWAFVAAFFWFYVGKQFGKLEMPKGKSLVLGNSLWIISLLLYIWQFILLDDLKRNFFIAGISQHYPLGFVWISSRLISLFTNLLDSTMVTIASHLIMLLVFIAGFIYNCKTSYEKMNM